MKPYVVLEKPIGQTPLTALTAWKNNHREYAHTPFTYAGRLDPMASGKLLVLIGDECKKREKYTGLDKEYEVEILLDVHTDTGDVLGLPALASTESKPGRSDLALALRQVQGSHTVSYPAFSSKPVAGKPLFMYALEGLLDTITIPTHTETVHSVHLVSLLTLSSPELIKRITNTLSYAPRTEEESKELGADFRQDQIRAEWDSLLETKPSRLFTVATVRVVCASGTYMRTLAERIASVLGTDGVALSIHRTKIGTYVPLLNSGFWLRTYK